MENKKIKVEVEIPVGYDLVQTGEGKWELRKIERKLPKTWEEFCETYPIQNGECFIGECAKIHEVEERRRYEHYDMNLLPNKKTAEAFLALMQLIQLRNCYNGDWKPDWTRPSEKYVFRSCCKDSDENVVIIADREYYSPRILTFKSEELRDKFLENFRDLIEIAKPLI